MGLGDLATAEAAVQAALEIGITRFDHADIYQGGRAESVFGELLARSPGLRERITIQTKCGISLDPTVYDLRGTTIVARAKASLDRLGIDAIDVLLLHRPDPLIRPDDVAAAFEQLRSEGIVRAFGVSNMSATQITQLDVSLVANQLEMSLHRRDWLERSDGTVEHCRRHGIELQAWGPLARGRYADDPLVGELARKHDTTPETIVLWWLQRHPAQIAPVIGTTNPDRIRACRDAAQRDPSLAHEEWYALWRAARDEPLP